VGEDRDGDLRLDAPELDPEDVPSEADRVLDVVGVDYLVT
jgi:hypothetical protein